MSIGEGVYYISPYFVHVPAQTIILEKYNNTPIYPIGLLKTESFADEISDPTLLDNATGSYNVNAPGAHRLKIDLSLSKSPGSTGTTNNRKAVTDFYILGYFDIDENNNSYYQDADAYDSTRNSTGAGGESPRNKE